MSDETKPENPGTQQAPDKGGDDPVLAKNRELLKEAKEAKARARELEAKLQEYDARATAEEQELAKKRGEFDKVEAALKEREAAALRKFEAVAVSSALKDALIKAGVAPAFMEAAEALMRAKGAKVGKDDTPEIDGRPVLDYVQEWAQSDAGKHFVAAPNSSGGGASGGGAAGGTKTMTRAAFDALSPAQRMEFSRSGGRLT